jgi:hypothetical protein
MKLTKEQKKANEKFFDMIIRMLNDGGTYGYPDAGAIFVKQNNKLTTEKTEWLLSVKDLVTEDYYKKTFELTCNTN